MAQWIDRSLPKPEIRSLNPDISKIFWDKLSAICNCNFWLGKDKNQHKRGPFLKKVALEKYDINE